MKSNASLAAALSLAIAGFGVAPAHAISGSGSSSGDERPGASYDAPAAYAQDQEVDPAASATGPAGSSRQAASRYDEVGYANIRPVAGSAEGAVVALHRSLPANSFAEVTALDTGKTILVLITGPMEPDADHPIDLSPAAARQLGHDSPATIAVRVRRITPTASDQAALHQGQPAMQRADTPPVLLNALRKHLPTRGAPPARSAAPPPAPVRESNSRPTPPKRPVAATPAPSARGYFVQVAALSSAGNAQSLAQSMGGFVKPGGGLYRVQIGPFATRGQADAARQRAAGAGYRDARVFAN